MLTIDDFKPGDILKLKRCGALPDCEAEVTCVDYNDNGLVTYSGRECGQGAFDPATLGDPSRYQTIIGVEKIGFQQPWRPFHPAPGNPSYDCVH